MKWEVRVAGPDDVVEFETELEALRRANAINIVYIADRITRPDPDDEVLCVATVHLVGERS